MGFTKLKLNKKLLDALSDMGISTPTEIQEKTIPLLYEGKDVVGHSQTGSGKTAAFGLPILESVKIGEGAQALILTPTRELAVQVKEELEQLGKNTGVKIVVIHGGVGFRYQNEGAKVSEIIVATPGRLMDHLQRRTVRLNKIKFVVLDEADRMLDMGFERDVGKILRDVPKQRQTIMFSATMPISAQRMIKKYMKHPAYIEAEKYVDDSLLKQIVYKVDREHKFSLLVHLLKYVKGTALVFCRTKRETDKVAKNLRKQDFGVRAVHGDLTQNKRQHAVNELKEGKIDILVGTDVAARGLHLPGVSHVYNYDLPDNADDYTHRIGRTARAGAKGDAIIILCKRDADLFRLLIKSGMKIKEEPTPEFEKVILVKDKFNLPRSEKRKQGKNPFSKRAISRGGARHRSRDGDEEKDGLYGFKKRGRGKAKFGKNRSYDSRKFKGRESGSNRYSKDGESSEESAYKPRGRSKPFSSKPRRPDGFRGNSSRGLRRKHDSDESDSSSGPRVRGKHNFKKNIPRDSDKYKKNKKFGKKRFGNRPSRRPSNRN